MGLRSRDYVKLAVGTRVRTVKFDHPDEWQDHVIRKWGVTGTVFEVSTERNRSRRFPTRFYQVKHDDGTPGGYDGFELEILLDGPSPHNAFNEWLSPEDIADLHAGMDASDSSDMTTFDQFCDKIEEKRREDYNEAVRTLVLEFRRPAERRKGLVVRAAVLAALPGPGEAFLPCPDLKRVLIVRGLRGSQGEIGWHLDFLRREGLVEIKKINKQSAGWRRTE